MRRLSFWSIEMNPTVRQQRILDWLKRVIPHGARLFETALRVRDDATIPCRSRVIAHAFRELCSCLENLNGQTNRVKLDALAEKLVQAVSASGFTFEDTPISGGDPRPKGRGSIQIPWKVAQAVRDLITAQTAEPKGPVRAQALLNHLHGRKQNVLTEVSATAGKWHQMARTFTRCCHDRHSDDLVLLKDLEMETVFLEEILSSFVEGAVDNLAVLDEILAQANA